MSNDKTESISARLRRVADEKRNPFTFEAACEEFEVAETPGWGDLRSVLYKIADEIDREMDELRNKFRVTHPMQAVGDIAAGKEVYPLLREAIDRYYLPRPLFENGEPVQFGDRYVQHASKKLNTVSSITYSQGDGLHVRINNGGRCDASQRYRRELPVLDADGVPIEVGDVVYPNYGTHANRKSTVLDVRGQDDVIVSINGGGFERFNGKYLTHREPDTQERIDMDALKDVYEYWGRTGTGCSQCPALVDGKKPKHRYGVIFCSDAMRLDLLRRQRELDGRDA